MAYLKPQMLTCAQCDFRSEITWVIGVGPHSKPGVKPDKNVHKTGGFMRDAKSRDTLICPNCGTVVL